jgi:hypothetical protein
MIDRLRILIALHSIVSTFSRPFEVISMTFLEHSAVTLPEFSDMPIIEVCKCPHWKKFVALSPTGFAVYSALKGIPTISSQYAHFQMEYGVFQKSAWICLDRLAVLTTLGHILVFHPEVPVAALRVVISPPGPSTYLSIAAFTGLLLLGDDSGNLIVISDDYQVVRTQNVSEFPVKQIVTSTSYGLLLTSDSSVFTFRVSATAAVPSFELKKHRLPATMLAACELRNMGAFFVPTGALFVTDYKGYAHSYNVPRLTAFGFSRDGATLFMFSGDQIGIWSSAARRIYWTSRPDAVNAHSIAPVVHGVLVAAGSQLLWFSLRYGSNLLLRGESRLTQITVQAKKIEPIVHEYGSFGLVEFAVPDASGRFIAIASVARLGLIDAKTGELLAPKHPGLMIRGLEWHSGRLCVLDFQDNEWSVKVLGVSQRKLEIDGIFSMDWRPLTMESDRKGMLVVSMDDRIVIFDEKLEFRTIQTAVSFIRVAPFQRDQILYGITRKHEFASLSLLSDASEPAIICENAADFWISEEHCVIFLFNGNTIFVAPIAPEIKFSVFRRVEAIPIGIDIANSSMILVHDLQPQGLPFFDFSVLLHTDNDPLVAVKLLERFDKCQKVHIVRILITGLRANLALKLLRHIDGFCFDELLVLALARVESPDRSAVFQEIGTPIEYFCRLAAARFDESENGLTRFRESIQDGKIEIAIEFLPVLMEESGPTVGFPAALFCLEKKHHSSAEIEILLKFLRPIAENASAINIDRVSCCGIELDTSIYLELRQIFEEVVNRTFFDLRFEPKLMLELARGARISPGSLLADNRERADSDSMETLVANLTNKETEGIIAYFEKAGWIRWVVAMKIAAGESEIVVSDKSLKAELAGTEWRVLLAKG